MDINHLPVKKTALNPLWIISIFFSFTEGILGYAVFNTESQVQIILTVFVIIFPTFVSIMFFVIVWQRPKHLYAPTDYQTDQSFLESFKDIKTVDRLSSQIENIVKENLNSNRIVDELKGGRKTEEVLRETADTIVKKIREDNFITVDIAKFHRNKKEILTFAYDSLKTFNDLTNQVFYKLHEISNVSYFSYGYEWLLKHEEGQKIIKGARMITGTPKGEFIDDKRTLEEVGIFRGAKLFADKP